METIKQLLERKIHSAEVDLENAYVYQRNVLGIAEREIAKAEEKLRVLKGLLDLDWDSYARIQLENK